MRKSRFDSEQNTCGRLGLPRWLSVTQITRRHNGRDRVYAAIIDDLFDVLCFGIYIAA